MFAKVVAGSHFHKYHEMESKVIDISVDTISQWVFIKTIPGSTLFVDSEDLQHTFGFMTSNESLEVDDNLSISRFVHDFHLFHSIVVFTDFIDDTFFGRFESACIEEFSD